MPCCANVYFVIHSLIISVCVVVTYHHPPWNRFIKVVRGNEMLFLDLDLIQCYVHGSFQNIPIYMPKNLSLGGFPF